MPIYTLKNKNGLVAKIANRGGIVTELHVPDRRGQFADVVLGFDTIEEYGQKPSPYFGAMIGRVANRIRGAAFELEGKAYSLAQNDPPHCLHGGITGWDKAEWNALEVDAPSGPELHLTYTSPDGEEGFPGEVQARVEYALTHQDEFVVRMQATTDRSTLVNMAHHTYWNLGGHDSGSMRDHELTLFADEYTPPAPVEGGEPVPDGRTQRVEGTPFDFRTAKAIGRDLDAVGGTPIGYDHNWVVRGNPTELRRAARVKDPKSGRVLTLEADQPGLQFYSGKFLNGSHRGKGAVYEQYAGFCLETQKFPNAINVPEWQSQVILPPGETYRHTMIHRFSAE